MSSPITRIKNKDLSTFSPSELEAAVRGTFDRDPEQYSDFDLALAWELFDRVADERIELL